jgi:hypothetical protein
VDQDVAGSSPVTHPYKGKNKKILRRYNSGAKNPV